MKLHQLVFILSQYIKLFFVALRFVLFDLVCSITQFIPFCIIFFTDFKEKKFVEFLDANKLCKEAQHFIIHSISMVNDDASTMEGVRATKKFLQSLGRYGNCAFLYPLYGVGEIPQAFSRFVLCLIF